MDFKKDCDISSSCRDLIIRDLHGDVFDELRVKKVLSLEEYKLIKEQEHQTDQNETFLNIITSKNEGLDQLINALRTWYSWIEEELLKEKKKWEESIAPIKALPRLNVSREALLNQVRAALKGLKKGYYVVLHGMSGCGKSTLAAEALHHQILQDHFKGKVHWLSCRQDIENGIEDHVLGLQTELYVKLFDDDIVKMEDLKSAHCKTMHTKLSKRFENSNFKDGLVVLDDVNSAKVIEALNIGCKTLVTTQDQSVMNKSGKRYFSIKVDEGFTEEESLKLLAQSVGLNVEDLPPQAKQIHKHGKGHPIILSLIGGALGAYKEEAKSNPEVWKPYLDVLIRKDYGVLKRMSSDGDSIFTCSETIELCINNLSEEMRERYQDFALFVEDVNIKTEVLQTLWNLTKEEVKTILEEFEKKSLVVLKFNNKQDCYVCGIHDILLYHLKKKLNKDELEGLHLKLVHRYEEICKKNPGNLPRNDNYIFYYIGYHLASAKQYELFQKWYFDLNFIEGKLKVAGPVDLLLDYKRYHSYFVHGLLDETKMVKKLTDFRRFVELVGLDVRRNMGPDIIQFGLQEPHQSEVYHAALRLAQSRPNTTYLRFQLGPSESRSAPIMIPAKDKVACACFAKGNNDLIVGFESGMIQIINQKGYVTRVYEGHDQNIKMLNVSLEKNVFLSVSGSCTKVWKLPDLDSNPSKEGDARTPSPSQRQTDFTDIFNQKTVDKWPSWFTFDNPQGPVDWACFSTTTKGLKLASCCSKQEKVEIWEITNKEKNHLKSFNVPGSTCVFTQNDELLIVGCSSSYIWIYDVINNVAVTHLVDSYPILALFAVPVNKDMKFGSLTKATLCVWDVQSCSAKSSVNKHKPQSVPCLREYSKGESESYICCAAATDGSVVAVATNSGKILICVLSDGTLLQQLDECDGVIKYLAMDKCKEHNLLGSYDDATLRLWTLRDQLHGKPAMMKPDFDVAWVHNNDPIVVAPTTTPCLKRITNKTKSEDLLTRKGFETTICGISKCGKYVAARTSNGEFYLHGEEVGSLQMNKILKHVKSVIKLKVEVLQKDIFVIIGFERHILVWKCEEVHFSRSNKEEIFTLSLNERLINFYILSRKELVTVTQNGCVKIWNLDTRELVDIIYEARLDVNISGCNLSCENLLVTLDSRRHILSFHNLKNKVHTEVRFPSDPSCCRFSIDGKKLVVGFASGLIEVRDTGKVMDNVPILSQYCVDEAIISVCVSDEGMVSAATKSRVILITASGSTGQAKLSVRRLFLSPDNSTIVTVDTHGHLHLINDFKNPVQGHLFLRKPDRTIPKPKGKHSLSLP